MSELQFAKRRGRPPLVIRNVVNRIQAELLAGGKPGERLPGERALARRYGVSRPTISAVMAQLERDHLVVRFHGSGTYIGRFAKGRPGHWTAKEIGLSFAYSRRALADPFRAEFLDGLLAELRSAKMNLLISPVEWRYLKSQTPADFFTKSDLLGVVALERHTEAVLRSLRTLAKPVVAADFDACAVGLNSVCFDNQGAGEILAGRLKRLGHRRVAAVFEDPERPLSEQDEAWAERRAGFLAAWRQGGNPPEAVLLLENRGKAGAVLPRLKGLLRQKAFERPSALIWPNMDGLDEIRQAAAECGLRVPTDLSVLGFGPLTGDLRMSGIRFSGYDLGLRTAEIMLTLACNLKRSSLRPRRWSVAGHFVAGQTHAPCR